MDRAPAAEVPILVVEEITVVEEVADV